MYGLLLVGIWTGQSLVRAPLATLSSLASSSVLRQSGAGEDSQGAASMSLAELEEYARVSGLRLKAMETGPLLRLEAHPIQSEGEGESDAIGYLTAFIRPLPFGLFHLDTIQVKNRRQNIGFQRRGYTMEGPGISFLMGSYALVWAQTKGCKTTQLLAVKDTEEMHGVLVRLYESFGFRILRSVGDERSSIADRLVWGAVGTLMEMDIGAFMLEWSPKLRSMIKMARLQASRQQQQQQQPVSVAKPESVKRRVALTREDGANGKLAALLSEHVTCLELPCIAFGPGKDTGSLPSVLRDFDVTVITSPQAAAVYLTAWRAAGCPEGIRLATVGKGTSKPLLAAGLAPVFEPSDATAETLAAELPSSLGPRVLYPSSSLAENTLALGLASRGFTVTKLDTYETVPAEWSAAQLAEAKAADVVTFASPSTVKVWAERVGTSTKAVVIGPTSAKACRSAGWKEEDISSPEGSKGIEAWAALVKKACFVQL